MKAYGLIVFFVLACAVILPFPEELLVLGAGLVAHAGAIAGGGRDVVNPITMSIVCYLAIFLSDLLVYFLGKFAGGRIIQTQFFQMRFAGKKFDRINEWFAQYGGWAAAFFRFTPGMRFPGHLCCGFLGMTFTRFAVFDALACLIFIPPQILFIAYFGEVIIQTISEVLSWGFYGILIIAGIWLGLKAYRKTKVF